MALPLRVLIIDDSPKDVADLLRELRERGSFDPIIYERVDTRSATMNALVRSTWDLVISDCVMPRFNAPGALKLVRESGIGLPFIIVSDKDREDVAVEAMKAGAHDFIARGDWARLIPAILRELRQSASKRHDSKALCRWRRNWGNIFHSIGHPIAIIDPQYRIMDANQAVGRTLRNRKGGLLGLPCYEVLCGISRPAEGCPQTRVLQSNQEESAEILMVPFGGTYQVTCTPVFGDSGSLEQIIHLATDITSRVCVEEQLRRSLRKLDETLEGALRAIALTIETKDPLTAGHQRKVAELAFAIAKELELSDQEAELIKEAGLLLNLGNINIPSEVLSKPGLLDPEAQRLVKEHCQVGHDILRQVDFPWPIA